jgi:FlaA1/EpsC-like NDP-sugar epimerase
MLRFANIRALQLFAADLLIVTAAIVGAMVLRFDSLRFVDQALIYFPAALFPLFIRPFVNFAFGLYSRVWAYASIAELARIATAIGLGSVLGIFVFYGVLVPLGVPGTVTAAGRFPRSFFVIEGLLTLLGTGGVRFLVRAASEWRGPSRPRRAQRTEDLGSGRVPTLVYGAGDAGAQVLRTIASARDGLGMRIVGLLDDDKRKHGLVLRGKKVIGGLKDLELAAARTGARRLVIAIPTASGDLVRRAVEDANRLGLETRTLPAFEDLVTGRLSAAALREVRVDDLLRRATVQIDEPELREMVRDGTVLVTGAGGSIGSELARQVFDLDPSCLVLLDRAEGPLYDIERELSLLAARDSGTPTRAGRARPNLKTRLANVVTPHTMTSALAEDKPVLVLHAAAYKHVPMMEYHPVDAVFANLGGTLTALRAAEAAGVERFVLVSTDKAVSPTSVMGASKRLAELATAAVAGRSGRAYVSVRFGNVLGSSGSVIPLLQRQLAEGVPLTITHPDMTRYFMTIAEAARLILEAALMGKPGDVFVLDMGEPIKILDLARDLARLAGRDPDSVPIQYIGPRPGEKLSEALFYDWERVEPTSHPKVLKARQNGVAPMSDEVASEVLRHLDAVIDVARGADGAATRSALFETLADLDSAAFAP